MNRIDVFVVDFIPQGLELLLRKVLVELVDCVSGSITIFDHGLKRDALIEDRLDEGMDAVLLAGEFLAHRHQFTGGKVVLIVSSNLSFVVSVFIHLEIAHNRLSIGLGDGILRTIDRNDLAGEVFDRHLGRTVAESLLGLFLEVINEGLVALVGNDRQFIDVLDHLLAELFQIHPVAVLVHADTKATADFLTFRDSRCSMAQRTDLENVRVVPALTES